MRSRRRGALAAVLFVAACGDPPARAEHATARLPAAGPAVSGPAAGEVIAVAETATVEVPLELPAQLYVENDAAVVARSGGIVESVLVDLGGRVAAGQTMARLESADQGIAVAQARQRFEIARRNAARERQLAGTGVLTRADSEQVESAYESARLELRKAQRDYDLTRIVAPFSGVVTARTARAHRVVESGDSLFRVTALGPVLAAVRVPEGAAFDLRVGSEAEVRGQDGRTARAKVIRGSPVVDAASGTREVVLRLAPGASLRPGSSATVRLGGERRRVVAIPRAAVNRDGHALVRNGTTAALRALTLGGEIGGGRVEVVRGLAPGDTVLRHAP